MFAFEFFFLLTFPLLLACGVAYLTWRALSRPAVFLIVATVALYLVYAAAMWLLSPGPVGYTVSIQESGGGPALEPFFLLLPPYKIPLLTFLVAAIPVLTVLLRAFKKGRAKEA